MSERRGRDGKGTKQLTVCAMLAALGVILLYLGAMIEVLDISVAVIASLLCVVAVIEYGGGAPWMIYGVTSVLSVILLPNKTPALMYALFFGFYPILKEKFEKRPRAIAWVLKLAVFNVSLAIIAFLTVKLTLAESNAILSKPLFVIAAVVVCEAVFLLYDVAMTRVISFYIVNLRKRFKF